MKQYVERISDWVAGVAPKKGEGPKKREGQPEEEGRGMLLVKGVWAMVFVLAALAIVKGAVGALAGSITVSSSVNGQELPIYCVETDKKQVALTFDAAGGNGDIGRILGILEKHGIHATFFMTGGWVGGWAYMKKLRYGVKCMF